MDCTYSWGRCVCVFWGAQFDLPTHVCGSLFGHADSLVLFFNESGWPDELQESATFAFLGET